VYTVIHGGVIMKKSDWLLLALHYSENGLSPIQLQKSLFLLGTEREKQVGSRFYRFSPYNYGPFDSTIYADAENLAKEGWVSISEQTIAQPRQYEVTHTGRVQATRLEGKADPEALEYLKRVVQWVKAQSFRSLVEAIYRKYPQQRAKSVFVS
jgi:hypothetical protein